MNASVLRKALVCLVVFACLFPLGCQTESQDDTATPPPSGDPIVFESIGLGQSDPRAQEILNFYGKLLNELDAEAITFLSKVWDEEVAAARTTDAILAQLRMTFTQFGKLSGSQVREIFVGEIPVGAQRGNDGFYASDPVASSSMGSEVSLRSPVPGSVAIILSDHVTETEAEAPIWVSVILRRGEESWHPVDIYCTPRIMAGHDAAWFLAEASRYEENGRLRNARLYRELSLMLRPSEFVRPAWEQQVRILLGDARPPHMPNGDLTVEDVWTTASGESFPVYHVTTLGTTAFFKLDVRYWTDDPNAMTPAAHEQRTRLFEHIAAEFPEYAEAFDGVLIGTMPRENPGHREHFAFDQSGRE